ncbi:MULTISPECIES: ATP-grasp domain-containing protein [Bacillus cereus group]|uniref:Carboxylate--amine ligase n=1 Tax=Bacillus thuringiensis TaxID=1428 RepID=A0A1C4E324_BACTU|nr:MULTISPECIES: ATP-grasp domain-containing protein [Bacillus cereus group]MED3025656.1 ATP-grasp domain-containing protein [Bacillus wiedmannii]OTX98520.1 hypothetical protein BK729_13215 [Bacillus thuringiensis serovar wratislaviensis]OUB59122.1 hypothetical protein BK743_13110 [Bacillus thuringiensis serovar sylvestriensis]SCC37950.1 Carboxylate--amine ligase [Bacillus thuringiensis]
MKSKSLIMVTPWVKYVRKAKNEDIYCVSIWKKNEGAENLLQKIVELSDETYIFDITNYQKLETVIKATLESTHIDYIFHAGREDTMLETYKIAEKYGKALNSSNSIAYINNKLKMRELLEKYTLSPVLYIPIETITELDEASENFEFPFIIKPQEMSGSRAVYLCRNNEDVSKFKEVVYSYNYLGPFIIEEFLEGPEVSVEVISNDGIHHVIGITDKIKSAPPYFVEMGHIHPSQLDSEAKSNISKVVTDFLTLAKFTFGPTHTEVILTKNGPRIVESQARFGGDQIPQLVNLATGIDIESLMFKMLNDEPFMPPKKQRVAAISYFSLPMGILKDVSGISQIQSLPYVQAISFTLKPGDNIPQIKDSKTRHGYFIVVGENHEEVENHKNTVHSLINVEISKGNLQIN